MTRYIQTGDFCEIVSDKFVEHGVKRGHIIYVAGHKALPVSDEDPYTQRIKFFAHLYNPKTYEMGKELYLMDANSILWVGDAKQEAYLEEYKIANGID